MEGVTTVNESQISRFFILRITFVQYNVKNLMGDRIENWTRTQQIQKIPNQAQENRQRTFEEITNKLSSSKSKRM
jgi:hypothetical protein